MERILGDDQARRLGDALAEHFDFSELRAFVRKYLEVDLAPTLGLAEQASQLVEACRANGSWPTLVVGALAERPGSETLTSLAASLELRASVVDPREGLEKLAGDNRIAVDVLDWMERCQRMSRRICQVRVDGHPKGTAFLVGPDLVLTCDHVLAGIDDDGASRLAFVFDYARRGGGKGLGGDESFRPARERWRVEYSTTLGLDFALIRLTAAPGARRGWLPIPADDFDFGAHRGLAILQHPEGAPLKLAIDLAAEADPNGGGDRVYYVLPTQRGSSGSPVFSAESWRLVALHRGWDKQQNQGVPIAAVAKVIRPHLPGPDEPSEGIDEIPVPPVRPRRWWWALGAAVLVAAAVGGAIAAFGPSRASGHAVDAGPIDGGVPPPPDAALRVIKAVVRDAVGAVAEGATVDLPGCPSVPAHAVAPSGLVTIPAVPAGCVAETLEVRVMLRGHPVLSSIPAADLDGEVQLRVAPAAAIVKSTGDSPVYQVETDVAVAGAAGRVQVVAGGLWIPDDATGRRGVVVGDQLPAQLEVAGPADARAVGSVLRPLDIAGLERVRDRVPALKARSAAELIERYRKEFDRAVAARACANALRWYGRLRSARARDLPNLEARARAAGCNP